jgi:hypothetical protein
MEEYIGQSVVRPSRTDSFFHYVVDMNAIWFAQHAYYIVNYLVLLF